MTMPTELDADGNVVIARVYLPAPVPLVAAVMDAVADAYPAAGIGKPGDGRGGHEIVLVVPNPEVER